MFLGNVKYESYSYSIPNFFTVHRTPHIYRMPEGLRSMTSSFTVHGTPNIYRMPEGEWISRAGHLEQVFQINV